MEQKNSTNSTKHGSLAHNDQTKKDDIKLATHSTYKKHEKIKSSSRKTVLFIISLIVWTSASLIVSQYIIIYSLYFLIGREQLSSPLWVTVADALIYSLTLFLVIFVPTMIFRKKTQLTWKTGREQLGLRELPTWIDIGLAPVGFIVYLILAGIIVAFFTIFPFFDINELQETGYHFLNAGLDRTVAFIALCLIAPIAEEIIFRGFLYGKLRETISGKWSMLLSILITSVLFGILHGQWNVGVNVFAMSIILCGLREITGTIYSGIILHIIKNTVAFILLYIITY